MRKEAFDELKRSLQEMVGHAAGKVELRTTTLKVKEAEEVVENADPNRRDSSTESELSTANENAETREI